MFHIVLLYPFHFHDQSSLILMGRGIRRALEDISVAIFVKLVFVHTQQHFVVVSAQGVYNVFGDLKVKEGDVTR